MRRCCDNHWLRSVSPLYACARCQDAHCFFPYAVVCGVKQGSDHKSTPLKLGQLPHILEEAWLAQACSAVTHASSAFRVLLAFPDVRKATSWSCLLRASSLQALMQPCFGRTEQQPTCLLQDAATLLEVASEVTSGRRMRRKSRQKLSETRTKKLHDCMWL